MIRLIVKIAGTSTTAAWAMGATIPEKPKKTIRAERATKKRTITALRIEFTLSP
jgi:hypothetical protein